MARFPAAVFGALVLAAAASPRAMADEALACLTPPQQKAAIASGQAVPLASAIRSVRGGAASRAGRTGREVVKARLCRQDKTLVYVLTVLARDGKVTRATVDAGSGKLVDAR